MPIDPLDRRYVDPTRFGTQKLARYWDWIWDKIQRFEVQVLMGDFNMSFFRVIPELRSRGAVVDMGAWYPWKSLEGEPMSDSCGILFVNTPGVYTLAKGLGDLHDRDRTGLLTRPSAVAETGEEHVGDYDRIKANAGPGMPLNTYLPKSRDLEAKLSPSLTPSTASVAAQVAASPESDRKVAGIKIREKRLRAAIWRCNGVHQPGIHFPICVFTNNVGRRSPWKLQERQKKKQARFWTSRQQDPQSRTSPQQDPQPRTDPLSAKADDNAPDALSRWKARTQGLSLAGQKRRDQASSGTRTQSGWNKNGWAWRSHNDTDWNYRWGK